MAKVFVINLPSFLRRVLKAYELKNHVRSFGCQLHRIGRSRNWQLKADSQQIISIIELIEESQQPSWLWLSKLLRQQNEQLSHQELLDIASRTAGITVNQLLSKTDCTLAQARLVIDELEGLEG